MTLLEAIVACVVLSVAGVVCLEQAQGAARLQRQSAAWSEAVPYAEGALSAAASGTDFEGDATSAPRSPASATIRRMWRPGIDVIEVTIPVRTGGTMRLMRLVPSVRSRRP